MKLNNQEIITGIQQNDAKIWRYLYSQLGPLVLAHVLKNSGTREEGEELIQEVMLSIWKNIRAGKYKNENKFNNYFISVARNQWKNKLRSKKSRLQTTNLSLEETQIPDKGGEAMAEKAEKEATIQLMEHAMRELKEECQRLLRAFHYDGKRLKEMAEEQGINHGTMRKRIHDCRERLRKLLHVA